jgi:RNA polymerase sigma-70 factor, ECF subfamily
VNDLDWIESALAAARPRAVAALLRYFRDLDTAEEAVQNACLRALSAWPKNGPPRDPAAWLILVGRNFAVDTLRRNARQVPLPDEERISDTADAETVLAERLDEAHYRDDILRLLFVCCHPALPATQQIALALRIVSGLAVKEIARAFLVSEAAMEQRITRAKRRIAEERVPYEVPGAVERAERLAAVAAAIYLMFNEGYAATGGEAHVRAPLCEEAIRLARMLLRLFPSEPEIMGSPRSCSSSTRVAMRGSTPRATSSSLRIRTAAGGTAARSRKGWRCSTRRSGIASPGPIRSRARSPRSMPARRVRRTPTGARSKRFMGASSAWRRHRW